MAEPKDPALQLVLDDTEDAAEWHDQFVERCDAWHRAYLAILDESSPAAEWTFKHHPPYVMHTLDTILANVLDQKLRFKGNPRPRDEYDLTYITTLRDAATAQENLIGAQLDRCRITEKAHRFYLQGLICGVSAYKTYWRLKTRTTRRRESRVVPILGEGDQILGHQQVMEVVATERPIYDDPYAEVVDVRDLWWRPRGAVDMEHVESVCHRVWMTLGEIREKEEQGVYRKGSAAKLEKMSKNGDPFANVRNDLEEDLYRMSRTKDRWEVVERWTRERVITVAGGCIVLADTADTDDGYPFWHGDLPFVIASPNPPVTGLIGVSEVSKICELQEALWSLGGQRLDNTELLNNAVLFYREDVDPDQVELAPGAQNVVPGNPNDAVMVWSPSPITAQISLPAEQSLRGDIQNISASAPFSAGTDSGVLDQETATGVSIITSIAQRLLAMKKTMGNNAHERLLEQFAWLNRQFLTRPRIVEKVGSKGAVAYLSVRPEHFDPEVAFELEPAEESLLRSERRAESQALLQMAEASQMPCMIAGEPLDIAEFVRQHLRAYGIDDPERFFLPPEQAAQAAAALSGGQQGQPAPNGGVPAPGGNGTSPLATGPGAPSNPNSMSAAVFAQRMGAMGGREQ